MTTSTLMLLINDVCMTHICVYTIDGERVW